MDPNDYTTIESFVRSMEKAADMIRKKAPDCIIAPIFGALPFIDILNIIDDNFPNYKVEYLPASNRVYRVREVLREAFISLIEDIAVPDERTSFLSLDEVISGNSLTRVFKQFNSARIHYANRQALALFGNDADFRREEVRGYRDNISGRITYNSIAIVDSRGREKNESYTDLLEEGIVIPIETGCIVTMDRTDFFPARYKIEKDGEGRRRFLPVVDRFEVSSAYIDFLGLVAGILGKNPDDISMANMGKIRDSYKRVPEKLRHI